LPSGYPFQEEKWQYPEEGLPRRRKEKEGLISSSVRPVWVYALIAGKKNCRTMPARIAATMTAARSLKSRSNSLLNSDLKRK
jgi:hypothetical protein